MRKKFDIFSFVFILEERQQNFFYLNTKEIVTVILPKSSSHLCTDIGNIKYSFDLNVF